MEQLTVALFMETGLYYTNINSGINIILNVRKKSPEELCSMAKEPVLLVLPSANLTNQDPAVLIFYYNQIPLRKMDWSISSLINLWSA